MKKLAKILSVLVLAGMSSLFVVSCDKDNTNPTSNAFTINGIVTTNKTISTENVLTAIVEYETAEGGDAEEIVGESKIEPNKHFKMDLNVPTHLEAFSAAMGENIENFNISNPDAKFALFTSLKLEKGETNSILPIELLICGLMDIFNGKKGERPYQYYL